MKYTKERGNPGAPSSVSFRKDAANVQIYSQLCKLQISAPIRTFCYHYRVIVLTTN